MKSVAAAMLAVMLLMPSAARAEDTVEAPSGLDTYPHVSDNGHWAGATLILIGGLFLAAAAVGPVVHDHNLDSSHDEPDAAHPPH
jgi:hypothetical protein